VKKTAAKKTVKKIAVKKTVKKFFFRHYRNFKFVMRF
jgi:hypothetical protein